MRFFSLSLSRRCCGSASTLHRSRSAQRRAQRSGSSRVPPRTCLHLSHDVRPFYETRKTRNLSSDTRARSSLKTKKNVFSRERETHKSPDLKGDTPFVQSGSARLRQGSPSSRQRLNSRYRFSNSTWRCWSVVETWCLGFGRSESVSGKPTCRPVLSRVRWNLSRDLYTKSDLKRTVEYCGKTGLAGNEAFLVCGGGADLALQARLEELTENLELCETQLEVDTGHERRARRAVFVSKRPRLGARVRKVRALDVSFIKCDFSCASWKSESRLPPIANPVELKDERLVQIGLLKSVGLPKRRVSTTRSNTRYGFFFFNGDLCRPRVAPALGRNRRRPSAVFSVLDALSRVSRSRRSRHSKGSRSLCVFQESRWGPERAFENDREIVTLQT